MKHNLFRFCYTVICLFHLPLISSQQAVVIVPVADLVGQSMSTINLYKKLPLSDKAGTYVCQRLAQLLFNEVVTVLETRGPEALIRIPHLFFITSRSDKKNDTFWTLKRNLMTFDQLKRNGVDTARIPQPLSYKQSNLYNTLRNSVTLHQPYYDRQTRQTYSSGTRFLLARKQPKKKYRVFALDPSKKKMRIITIPHTVCTVGKKRTPIEQRKLFLHTVKQWTSGKKGFIPYVLGGCSYGQRCKQNIFKLERPDTKSAKSIYTRTETPGWPKIGLDCVGIIARASQLAGIPFFYKNTTTLQKYLKPVTKKGRLVDGDLIWIPGHVMVISGVKENKLIEARSYDHGYGIIQEIPLAEEFKNMNSYQDLLNAFFDKKGLVRLDKKGNVVQRIRSFKILKLPVAVPTGR